MNKKTKLKIYFFSFFIVSMSLIIFVLNSLKTNSINKYLNHETELINLNYQVIYNNYKNIAELIFKTHIQEKEILTLFANRQREELKEFIDEKYKKLRVFNLRQLHFHLPNNDSFLRMHRPNKFGDNLTNARKTVAFVNQNKKYIDGFEEGKIFNGFRFVYPLFLDNKHIGSVEVSFSALFFIKEIAKNYNVNANFLIKKEVVDEKVFKEEQDNYIQSPLKEYYYQRAIYEKLNLEKYNRKIENTLESKILSNMKEKKSFSVSVREFHEVATFIPLINPITKENVAFLKINKKDMKVEEIQDDFMYYLVLLTLLILVILIYLFSQYNYQTSLEETVKSKTKSLNKLNKNLEKTIEKEVSKNREKDELMIAQSRHAAMGEMISLIAHQWRQPLTSISMDANNILADIELEILDTEELKDTSKMIIEKTQYLSKTVEDFRNFFKPEKKSETVFMKDLIENTMNITTSLLKNHNINISVNCNSSKPINTYSRELLQVFVNIIKNAEEALDESEIKNKEIRIFCKEDNDFIEVEFFNNGNKIPNEIIEKIFEPYFTTKDSKTGTGLGLYMCKIIIEKHLNGKLYFENKENGVSFKVKLPFNHI